eukprot:4070805-Pyramimonas_sp.AAC.1
MGLQAEGLVRLMKKFARGADNHARTILTTIHQPSSEASSLPPPRNPPENEFLAPVGEFAAPVGEFLAPVGEFLAPVGEFSAPTPNPTTTCRCLRWPKPLEGYPACPAGSP